MKVMVIVKATKKRSEAGELPSEQLLTAMGKFNEELVKAGDHESRRRTKAEFGQQSVFTLGDQTAL